MQNNCILHAHNTASLWDLYVQCNLLPTKTHVAMLVAYPQLTISPHSSHSKKSKNLSQPIPLFPTFSTSLEHGPIAAAMLPPSLVVAPSAVAAVFLWHSKKFLDPSPITFSPLSTPAPY